MASSEGSVERADGVVQTEPVLNKREKEIEEPEKLDSISDDSEIDPVVTKKQESAPATFESIMAVVKLIEKHKIKRAETLLDLILQSEAINIGEKQVTIHQSRTNNCTSLQIFV